MKKTHKASDLITPSQAAEILGRPARTVRHWVANDAIKSVEIGVHRFVSRRAILRLKAKLQDKPQVKERA